jgi:plasmid stability protein
MATLTIRNLNEQVKRGLQVMAAINGRSMEAEARALLTEGVVAGLRTETRVAGLGTAIRDRFAPEWTTPEPGSED